MMLSSVKWGKYIIGDLFERIETAKLPYKADELPKQPCGEYVIPCLTSSFRNQGLNYYVPREGATILKHVISIPSNSDVYRAYYQSREFTVLSDAYAIRWKNKAEIITSNQYLFMVMCINKITDLPIYSYKNKLGGWNVVKTKPIMLPVKNGKIDFKFMDDFIAELEAERVAELEAYLSVTGLKDTQLTKEEKSMLENYDSLTWKEFNLEELYGKATRGKRLKGADRISGDLPFVTAGETDEGISAFIGNNVQVFSRNTTTIDMFGSAKYRNYEYGGDDHVAVVHTEKLPKYSSIFVTSAIHKSSHTGQFDYGKNFYAKDADMLNINLPEKGGEPDYECMELLISAIHKLVIRDVVKYSAEKVETTKDVIKGQRTYTYHNFETLSKVAERTSKYGE